MRHLWSVLVLLAAPVQAEEWQALSGVEIADILTGHVVRYSNGWQDFRASGRTLYNVGRESWGYWAVQGDQYCSMWPPSGLWDCYDMTQSGNRVRFIGAAGDVTEGAVE